MKKLKTNWSDWTVDIMEILAAIEGENLGRLSACWIVIAAERSQTWGEARKLAIELGVPASTLDRLESAFDALPETSRGYFYPSRRW